MAGRLPGRESRAVVPALVAAIVLGTLLRVAQYLSGRSLWHDEALLALNIIAHSPRALLGDLDFFQAAPPGFLLAAWGVAQAAGYSEEALRLLSLTAGIVGVGLFAALARRVLEPWPAVAATLVVALADGLVAYSAEFKPYSSDALVTIVLLLLGLAALDPALSYRKAAALAVGGAIAITASYPSVFVAASVVLVLVLVRPGRPWLRPSMVIAGAWGVTATTVILGARRRTNDILEGFERSDADVFGRGAPTGSAGGSFEWLETTLRPLDVLGSALLHALGHASDRPLSHVAKLVAALAVVGLVSLTLRRPRVAGVVALPFLLTLVASQLEFYPMTERTTLFLVPLIALLLGEALSWVTRRLRGAWAVALGTTMAAAILLFPAYSAAYHVAHPRAKEELRPVLEELVRSWEAGDTLYLHPGSQYAFRYYADCGCLDLGGRTLEELWPFDRVAVGAASLSQRDAGQALEPRTPRLVLGRDVHADPARLRRDLERLQGRVWFVRSHPNDETEERFLDYAALRVLDSLGSRLEVIERPGASALLYRLRGHE